MDEHTNAYLCCQTKNNIQCFKFQNFFSADVYASKNKEFFSKCRKETMVPVCKHVPDKMVTCVLKHKLQKAFKDKIMITDHPHGWFQKKPNEV